MAGPPPPATDTIAQDTQTSQGVAKDSQALQQSNSKEDAGRAAPPAPPTQEELHQKYDVTKEDVTKAGQSVKQYERYQVVARADQAYADEHPMNEGARARAARSEAFAEKYYDKNLKPFEQKMMGPNGQPKEHLDYEPGASPEDAKKFAARAHIDHKVEPSITPDNDHIRVANGGEFSSKEIPGMRAEMLRDEARDKAREAVAHAPSHNGHAKAGHGPGL